MGHLRVLNPILYQGSRRKKNYFEGWYFKHTTGPLSSGSDGRPRSLVFIPGISRSDGGDHAFVQTLDGATGASRYFAFPVGAFSATDEPFEVLIGSNRFSLSGIEADLEDKDGRVQAEIRYGATSPPRSSILSPGVMGPYSFAPFMECRHGIASLDHATQGWATLTGVDGTSERLSFDGGRGYIEKDWGSSMPRAWVWLQGNNFDLGPGPASFTFSLARVPWRGNAFNGFICILWAAGTEYRFTTYTGARVDLLECQESTLRILLGDRLHQLEARVNLARAGALAAPSDGAMTRSINESADASLRIILTRKCGAAAELVFDSTSPAAGAEVVGDLESLKP